MVVYYIKKVSERLKECHFPIKEGDICMLYDGDIVKTVYIDSDIDDDSIWRDFKFIDTKSLKSYHFPTTDCILCAPIGDRHAIGDTGLLTQLIKECKGEWLMDFLNETSAILSGFVDYWDLGILSRFIGDNNLDVTYEKEEALIEFLEKPEENENVDEYDDEEDADDADLLPKRYDVKWFCLSVLACLEGQMDKRSYQILYDTLNGDTRSEIADRNNLTQERIRQIVVKATKQAKELLIEQHRNLEELKSENAQLNIHIKYLEEKIADLKALFPTDVLTNSGGGGKDVNEELTELLEALLIDINLSVRATNILLSMGIEKFSDIPQIESKMALLNAKNSGKKTLHEISGILSDFGLTFGMKFSAIVDSLKTYDWHDAKRKWIKSKDKESEKRKSNYKETYITIKKDIAEDISEISEINSEEATIILTRDIIEAARTPNGGFTKSQLAAIGIGWPPSEDWIKEKVGTMITQTQLEEFNRIEYVTKSSEALYRMHEGKTYKDVAFNSDDRRKMEATLQAMTHFYTPATPYDIVRAISRSAWGDEVIREGTVDSILKRLPEVEYIKWGKYILKSRNK